MSGTTSVPRPQFTRSGYLLPSEREILTGVQADLNAAFGGNLNPSLETPQGQIATTEAAIIADAYDQFLLLTQNVDPAFSSGRMQDAIGRIYFQQRRPAVPTTAQAECRGLNGVVIPVGALARATDGNYYTATAGGTIDATGTVSLPFACTVTGPIPCPAGQLNAVNIVIPGWDSITNLADGVLGQDAESRTAFELRRYASVANNSAGMLASVQSAVLGIDDVLDCYATENFTNAAVPLDGVLLPAHSLYVCVAGGAAADIGRAIFTRKAPGCDMAGDTTVTVQDTNGDYSPPYPSYTITYQTAAPQVFMMTVTLLNSTAVPATAAALIQNAILRAWTGADGGSRARIGSIIFASRYYGAVAQLGAWVQLISIKLGATSLGTPAATGTGFTTADMLTITTPTTGAFAIGQTIRGGTIPDGVRIIALGGVADTYMLNTALNTDMLPGLIVGYLPALDDVAVGAAHVPVLSAENIEVKLVASLP